jgi:hypothetical protein
MTTSGQIIDSGLASPVRKKPGLTTVVRIPNGSISSASAPIHPSSPNFDAAYTEEYGKPTRPAPDEIATTWPDRCCRITGNTARVTFIGPSKFVANCCSTWCGDISSKNPLNEAPALLTTTSIRPNLSTASFTAADDSSTLVTSSRTASRLSLASNAAGTSSGRRAVATTRFPAASAARTNDAPMPRDAPVINQTVIANSLLSLVLTRTVGGSSRCCLRFGTLRFTESRPCRRRVAPDRGPSRVPHNPCEYQRAGREIMGRTVMS